MFDLCAVRRLRTDPEWWQETLECFLGKHPLRHRIEDLQRDDHLRSAPLPTVVSEYKAHPLYVLRRDLLKYEALYPDNVKPVGYVRGEPVFPRTAVYLLHNKEGWMKKARVIKPCEEPYKIVKARPKWGVPKEDQQERPCPLYGIWQTDDYVPKPVVDVGAGVIPRNDYGNVEIFQPSMQPPGTVHLQLARVLDVAKKLGVDCAPVMTGWDFKGGRNAPVIDGYLVCTEHRDAVVAAWQQEELIRAEKQKQKRQERAIENWRRLTKGLLMQKAVNKKFKTVTKTLQAHVDGALSDEDEGEENQQEEDVEDEDDKPGPSRKKSSNKKKKANEKAAERREAWPKHEFSL